MNNSIALCGFCGKTVDPKVAINARLNGLTPFCDEVCQRADDTDYAIQVGAAMLRQS